MKYLKDLSEELRQELVNFELFRNSVLQYAPTGKWEGDGSDANPDSNRSAHSDRDLLFGRLVRIGGRRSR